MSPIDQRADNGWIDALDSWSEEKRNAQLAEFDRDLGEGVFDAADTIKIRRILAHYGFQTAVVVPPPEHGFDPVTGYDKYGNHISHSEESKADNVARIEAMEEAKKINVFKNGTPTRLRGEQIGHDVRTSGYSVPLAAPANQQFDNHGPDRANR